MNFIVARAKPKTVIYAKTYSSVYDSSALTS